MLDQRGRDAVGDAQPIGDRLAGQPAVVGPADQRPNLLEIEQQGHVAALASELPFPLHLAIEDQQDDVLAHAEGAVSGLRDGDLAPGRGPDWLSAPEQPGQEGIQILRCELVSSTVIAATNPRHDDAGPIEPVDAYKAWSSRAAPLRKGSFAHSSAICSDQAS